MTISDIQAEARALVDADSTSYPNADLLRRENAAYEQVVALIMGADGLWQFDDTNYTDFPIGVTTLVNSQQDYTFAADHLEVEGVSVLKNNGIWEKLVPIDDKSQISVDPIEFMKTDGLPLYYDKQGRSILLYPAPDNGVSVTLASGLKFFFKRTADLFTSAQVTTGTKEPGFASPFHIILAYKAALPYAQTYKKDRVPMIVNEIARLEKEILKHYGRREADRRKVLSMGGINSR